MLAELVKHKHLGNLNNILFVLKEVLLKRVSRSLTLAGIKRYCFDISVDLVYQIDGILALLEFTDITSHSHSSIKLNKGLPVDMVEMMDRNALAQMLIEKVLVGLQAEQCLNEFIPLEKIKFDSTLERISILNNLIPLRYSSIKNLLIDLGGFKVIPEYPSLLLIDDSLQVYFESTVIPWLVEEHEKITLSKGLNKMSLEKLLELQELKDQYGAQAEEFVLGFEVSRLNGHPFSQRIRRISNFDVGAGYDIVSFDGLGSQAFDRFIEVKSFSNHQQFYWSKNEVRVAELKRNNYFLYLVDREQMGMQGYKPTIIQDPYNNIFNAPDWQKDPQNWLIKPY